MGARLGLAIGDADVIGPYSRDRSSFMISDDRSLRFLQAIML